jgi:CHAT domain-containing protein
MRPSNSSNFARRIVCLLLRGTLSIGLLGSLVVLASGGAAIATDICCGGAAVPGESMSKDVSPGHGPEETRLGADARQRGQMDQALLHFQNAAGSFQAGGDIEGQIQALNSVASVAMALGETGTAEAALSDAIDIAKQSSGTPHLAALQNSLAAVYTFDRQLELAAPLLDTALAAATVASDDRTRASILNNRGILRSAHAGNLRAIRDADSPSAAAVRDQAAKADQAALADFQQSEQLASTAGDTLLAAKASANACLSAARAGLADDERHWVGIAKSHITSVDDGDAKAGLWLDVAQADQLLLAAPDVNQKDALLQSANDACMNAAAAAEAVGDEREDSYALGARGRLYESQGRTDDAITLTSRALFLAQKIQCPAALYRWQWQLGRLQRTEGQTNQAHASFAAAEMTVQSIRTDVATGLNDGTAHSSYRDVVGPLYLDLADSYFQKANSDTGDAQQQDLADAREVMQRLRVAEIDNFFLEPCEKIAGAGGANVIEGADANAAVFYFIPFPDRTEVLLSFGKTPGLHRVTLPEPSAALAIHARAFRHLLENRTSYRYLNEAQFLYDHLMRPILECMPDRFSQTRTLVIVADGELLEIPFAALNDGQHFLCEKYAVAVAPSSELIPAGSLGGTPLSVLAASYSEPKSNFAALNFVADEMSSLHHLYGATELPNAQFTVSNFKREIDAKPFRIVHIASHCSLGSDIRSSFILTGDEQGMDALALERCLLPAKYRAMPIELLTLSGCETAEGDNYRSTLGLAGIGIKCGARSTLATLWSVNDRTCSQVMADFYMSLRNADSMDGSHAAKAESLRQAQLHLLQDLRYRHASYWAPYLIIGNWQ